MNKKTLLQHTRATRKQLNILRRNNELLRQHQVSQEIKLESILGRLKRLYMI